MLTSSPRELATVAVHLVLVFFILIHHGVWISSAISHLEDPLLWQGDWHCIWSAGDAFLNGQMDGIYTRSFEEGSSGVCHEGYYWLYPPYALYVAAIPAFFSPLVAYIGMNVSTLIGFALIMVAIARLYPNQKQYLPTVTLLILASQSSFATFLIGQNSHWLLLTTLLAILSIRKHNWLGAALCIGVLALKPNWILFFILWLTLERHFRLVLYLACVGLLLLLSTLFMGPQIWSDFFVSAKGYSILIAETYQVDSLVTNHSFVRGLGLRDTPLFWPVWALLQGAAFLGALTVWRSRRSVTAKVGLLMLVTIACNSYINFYDLLLLTVPSIVWWFERKDYRTDLWWTIAALLTATWLWGWMRVYGIHGSTISPIGCLLTLWIVVEAINTRWLAVKA